MYTINGGGRAVPPDSSDIEELMSGSNLNNHKIKCNRSDQANKKLSVVQP